MSMLDVTKEKIAYLKLWLGIVMAVGVSLVSWVISNFQSADWLISLSAIFSVSVIVICAYAIHKRIEAKIAHLEKL